jgi:transposase InsO family protein
MAAANRRWGAERIRGEWLKLDIRVATSTIRRHLRGARPPRRSGQSWPTFLRNHVGGIWARDFLPVTDCRFRQVCAFFVIDLGSRRVAHVGVTRRPTDAWVAQQLREAMPYGQQPTCLSRDNVRKYGPAFARVAAASGIAVLRTASRPPRHNASCERFLGSMRRECLELLLALGVAHLRRILREYSRYRTFDRPHLGLEERIPDIAEDGAAWTATGSGVLAIPVPGGLHHAHARAA